MSVPLGTVVLVFFFCGCVAQPGPSVMATRGEVWPKPQQEKKLKEYYVLNPDSFAFKAPEGIGCPNFLNEALVRYWEIIDNSSLLRLTVQKIPPFLGYLDTLDIHLEEECASENILPSLGDAEDYNITINDAGAKLFATTIWGILRGLETFSQLIYTEDYTLRINANTIIDFPRFPHRGLLIDTSRHFQPVSVILQMLDAMAYNKMNVFHWHIVDDHSFPYKSRTYPELSDQGAYHPVRKVYQQMDVKRVIEYARLRGIRVVPEFDTPGHTSSWGLSHPEILTTCYTNNKENGEIGPIDPTRNTTYEFITELFSEVAEVFPDDYFHLGGDEVDFSCWQSNPNINKFKMQKNISSNAKLENYYMQHIFQLLDDLDTKYLVWQDIYSNDVALPNSTIVHVWRQPGFATLRNVVQDGKYGIFSSCWYLSRLKSGSDWDKFYNCEPLAQIKGEEQRKLVLGGEACMWGEYVNEFSIISRVWPRASTIAERLWSAQHVRSLTEAQKRLEEHSCRMNKRGIAAQPANGPGTCLYHPRASISSMSTRNQVDELCCIFVVLLILVKIKLRW